MRLRDANRTFEVQPYAQIRAACNVALRGEAGEASGKVRQVCGCTTTQSETHTFAGCLGAAGERMF